MMIIMGFVCEGSVCMCGIFLCMSLDACSSQQVCRLKRAALGLCFLPCLRQGLSDLLLMYVCLASFWRISLHYVLSCLRSPEATDVQFHTQL